MYSKQQTVSLDCIFRLAWSDNRFNLPQLFALINPSYASNGRFLIIFSLTYVRKYLGIEIIKLYEDFRLPLRIWRPDLSFVDARSMDVTAESFRIKPNGVIYWSRHLTLTISQCQFNYTTYPLDSQSLLVRYQSYAYPSTLLNINFADPPMQLYSDGTKANVYENALWSYVSYSSSIITNIHQNTVTSKSKPFDCATVYLLISRRSMGILLRLVFPILFVSCVAGIIFWAQAERRLSFAITLLLTVAALYISIFSSIPLVGYAMIMDNFVFCLFILLLSVFFIGL